jgi:hypothetical protein
MHQTGNLIGAKASKLPNHDVEKLLNKIAAGVRGPPRPLK